MALEYCTGAGGTLIRHQPLENDRMTTEDVLHDGGCRCSDAGRRARAAFVHAL